VIVVFVLSVFSCCFRRCHCRIAVVVVAVVAVVLLVVLLSLFIVAGAVLLLSSLSLLQQAFICVRSREEGLLALA